MRYTLVLAIAAATALDPPAAHAQTEATQAPVARQQVLSTTSASLLLRWYPQGAALQGFYLGLADRPAGQRRHRVLRVNEFQLPNP
jgi:hypothetical protein